MRRLIKVGLAKFFSRTPLDVKENALLQALRAEIDEFKPKVRNVYVRFVFTGNPKRAEEADTLKDLQEQIEERHSLIRWNLSRATSSQPAGSLSIPTQQWGCPNQVI